MSSVIKSVIFYPYAAFEEGQLLDGVGYLDGSVLGRGQLEAKELMLEFGGRSCYSTYHPDPLCRRSSVMSVLHGLNKILNFLRMVEGAKARRFLFVYIGFP